MAKQLVEVIGMCAEARFGRTQIYQVGNDIVGDVYWNLYSPEGALLVENKKTQVRKSFDHAPNAQEAFAFLMAEGVAHIAAQYFEFTGEQLQAT